VVAVRLDVAGRDINNRFLAKGHRRVRSRKDERANELESRVVVGRTNELIPATRTPFVRKFPERHGCVVLRFRLTDRLRRVLELARTNGQADIPQNGDSTVARGELPSDLPELE